jgi:hypothetical protein
MQLRKKIQINKYVLGTLINYSAGLYFLKIENYIIITVLFIGFISNQLFLALGLGNMFSDKPEKRATLYFILKFLILVIVMIVAMSKMPQNIALITGFYIFQLIILVLSIKRITK